jgi:hypothetical protein
MSPALSRDAFTEIRFFVGRFGLRLGDGGWSDVAAPGTGATRQKSISSGKLAVKILVAANPYPNPYVPFDSLGNRPIIARYADRPKTGIMAQTEKFTVRFDSLPVRSGREIS